MYPNCENPFLCMSNIFFFQLGGLEKKSLKNTFLKIKMKQIFEIIRLMKCMVQVFFFEYIYLEKQYALL